MAKEEIWVGENNTRRQLTGEELAEFEAMRQQIKDERAAVEAQKAATKAAVLERLGLTEEELKAVIG